MGFESQIAHFSFLKHQKKHLRKSNRTRAAGQLSILQREALPQLFKSVLDSSSLDIPAAHAVRGEMLDMHCKRQHCRGVLWGAVDGECSHFPSPPGHCGVYSTTVGSDTPEVLPSETGGRLSELLSLSRCFRVQWRALPRSRSRLGSHSLSQRCLCIFLKRNGRQHFHVFLSFKPLVVELKVEQGRHQILGVLIHTTSVLRKCFWKILDICNCVICKYQGLLYFHRSPGNGISGYDGNS